MCCPPLAGRRQQPRRQRPPSNSSGRNGFETYLGVHSCCPGSVPDRHASRAPSSPRSECGRRSRLFSFADRRGRFEAAHLRHLDIHEDNRRMTRPGRALPRRRGRLTRRPRNRGGAARAGATTSFLVAVALSSATRILSGLCSAYCRVFGAGPTTGDLTRRVPNTSHDRIEQIRLLDRLAEGAAANPASRIRESAQSGPQTST